MLIVGAKGFAKEVLEVLHQLKQSENVVFYDDVTTDLPLLIHNKFPIIRNLEDAQKHFETVNNQFTIGIGNPILRKTLYDKFTAIGGEFTTVISPFANIGYYGNTIENGCNIMTGTIVTSDIKIGRGVLINLNCTVGHDVEIGEFVEMSPGVKISGNCKIGNYANIGTNSTILPKIIIGANAIVGAGSVVTKNVPDDTLVVGIPAVFRKNLEKLSF